MRRLRTQHRVYVGLIPTGYLNSEIISRTISEGILYCGLHRDLIEIEQANPKTRFKALVKPDLSKVDSTYSKHGYVHPDIVGRTISEFFKVAQNSLRHAKPEVVVSAYSGFENKLRMANGGSETYKKNGFFELENQFAQAGLPVSVVPFESTKQARYFLSKGELHGTSETTKGAFNPEILASELFAESDFTIYCPKLKTNLLTDGIHAGIAMGGVQEHPSPSLNSHLVDMLEVCSPNLIVSDGVIAGVGSQYFGFQGNELGVMLISNNVVAHDFIASMMLGLDPINGPTKVEHIRLAALRGWGPSTLSQIEVGGAGIDTVKLLSQKTAFWEVTKPNVDGLLSEGLPFEIRTDPDISRRSISKLYFFDWLQESYRRMSDPAAILNWPALTVVIGKNPTKNWGHTTSGANAPYPHHRIVVLLGSDAVTAFEPLISKNPFYLTFNLLGVEISWVQLKNAHKHLLLKVRGRPPSEQALFRIFTMASFGKITLFKKDFFIPRWVGYFKSLFRTRATQNPVILTYKLFQNRWWAKGLETNLETREKKEYSQSQGYQNQGRT